MHWIVQENLYNEEGYERLISALDRLQVKYSVHKVIPFVGKLLPEPKVEGHAIIMGSYSLAKTAQRLGWTPGAYTET